VPDLRPLRRPAGHRGLSPTSPAARPRVAVDLLGAELDRRGLLDGVERALSTRPELDLVLVDDSVADSAAVVALDPERVRGIGAAEAIAAGDDPVRAVRARRRASVRIATRLLRDDEVDAVVSFGPPAATLAAAQFSLGRVPGMTKASFATELPRPAAGPVVLVDSGASPDASVEALVQHAYAGIAYARAGMGVAEPLVGLLSAGFAPGSGDPAHDEADRRLAALGFRYAGPARLDAVCSAGSAIDVLVTDGFTGAIVRQVLATAAGCQVVMGVAGVVVAAAPTSADMVADALAATADLVTRGVVPVLTDLMADLVAQRRGALA
jgi:phosphate acyltransferase